MAKKEVGETRLINGIIHGDAFSPLLFVLMIDPLIRILKTRDEDSVEVLDDMEDLKASLDSIKTAKKVNESVKTISTAVGIVVNKKKSAIQLSVMTTLPVSLGRSQAGRDDIQVPRL